MEYVICPLYKWATCYSHWKRTNITWKTVVGRLIILSFYKWSLFRWHSFIFQGWYIHPLEKFLHAPLLALVERHFSWPWPSKCWWLARRDFPVWITRNDHIPSIADVDTADWTRQLTTTVLLEKHQSEMCQSTGNFWYLRVLLKQMWVTSVKICLFFSW